MRTGSYKLLLLYLGYETDTISDIFVDEEGAVVDLGLRKLEPKSNLLDVVDIIAQAPLIIRNSDGLVYNIERTTLSTGEDGLSLLNHVPGVMINGANQLMVNGKKDVIILIDGRQQYVSGDELGNLLQTLSSETIKQVEVQNTASSKYDAAAGSAVINIVRKRASYSGTNGGLSVRYRQGNFHTEGDGCGGADRPDHGDFFFSGPARNQGPGTEFSVRPGKPEQAVAEIPG